MASEANDPVLFAFLKSITIPSNDRFPVPATTHVPHSHDNDTCWSRRCLAEETFGQPSLSLAVCYGAFVKDIGYTYQTLLAATREELTAKCEQWMTKAQLMTLLSHLPLGRKGDYNSLSRKEAAGLAMARSPLTARARRIGFVTSASMPSHILTDADGSAATDLASPSAPSTRPTSGRTTSPRRAANTLFSGFLTPKPPSRSGIVTAVHTPLPSQSPTPANYLSSPPTPKPPSQPQPQPQLKSQWPLYVDTSAEELKRRLEAAAANGRRDRVGDTLATMQKAMDPFLSDAAKAFTFKTLRFKEQLVSLGIAVQRAREVKSVAPKHQSGAVKRASATPKPWEQTVRTSTTSIVHAYKPTPVMVDELVVTYHTLVLLMNLAHFSPAERKHAQEVWTWELVDLHLNPKSSSKSPGSGRSASPPKSGGRQAKRRRPPFTVYGGPKYLKWLGSSYMQYDDFIAMIDLNSKRFLKKAFASFASSNTWYWMKFTFPKDLLSRENSSAGVVDEIIMLSSDEAIEVPKQVPSRAAVALRLFEEKRVDVLTFDDFAEKVHDDTMALVAFMGPALSSVTVKEINLTPKAERLNRSVDPLASGLTRTGRGASGAN